LEESSLTHFVRDNKKLTELNLTMNTVDMRYFFTLVSKVMTQIEVFINLKTLTVSCPCLSQASLREKGTQNENFENFFSNFNNLKNLENLDLSHAYLGVGGAKYLS